MNDCGCDNKIFEVFDDLKQVELRTLEELLECAEAPITNAKLRRIVMLVLRVHFSNPANYPDDYEHMKCLFYDPENNGTLHVGMANEFDDENPDQFPGIFVGWGGMDIAKLAMGDLAGASNDEATEHRSKGAKVIINTEVVSRTAHEALDLAEMVHDTLMGLSPVISHAVGAMDIATMGYDEPKKISESPIRYYKVAVPLSILYTHSVSLSLESHRIKRISAYMTSESAK